MPYKNKIVQPFVLVLLAAFVAFTFSSAAVAAQEPDSFSAMYADGSLAHGPVADKAMTSTLAVKIDQPTQLASVTFFNNQATFSAAAPGLTLEDFENGITLPGQVQGCGSPFSSDSPAPCFPAGELSEGFAFHADFGNTVALGAGIVPINGTTWVVADLFASGSFFTFSDPDVFAVGFELFSFAGSAITISVHGVDDVLLGTAIVPFGTNFFGVQSDAVITRVSAAAGAVVVYDNLQFGKGFIDTDGDGIEDDLDACPNSDLSPTIVIDGCDSGVDNTLGADGCTLSDLIGECAIGVRNHGQYVRCVSHLTNDLKKSGLISGSDKGAIMSCAGQADIP